MGIHRTCLQILMWNDDPGFDKAIRRGKKFQPQHQNPKAKLQAQFSKRQQGIPTMPKRQILQTQQQQQRLRSEQQFQARKKAASISFTPKHQAKPHPVPPTPKPISQLPSHQQPFQTQTQPTPFQQPPTLVPSQSPITQSPQTTQISIETPTSTSASIPHPPQVTPYRKTINMSGLMSSKPKINRQQTQVPKTPSIPQQNPPTPFSKTQPTPDLKPQPHESTIAQPLSTSQVQTAPSSNTQFPTIRVNPSFFTQPLITQQPPTTQQHLTAQSSNTFIPQQPQTVVQLTTQRDIENLFSIQNQIFKQWDLQMEGWNSTYQQYTTLSAELHQMF
ncbi:hypothetical protein BLNAU_18732 [Blattamonas nauphoetae]|uniref:Uncharacterized protein n=1 Tax=Blattamonas nauphoetae TaxID=2049346 RepID=A0ABQ9X3M3_9EUKA|nr:hypothetical protein BLNAU_18732 [Blattamonas nauphoetae]